MQFSDFMGLLGGLALFLYGMQMMSGGLEAAAGDRMKQILEKLTSNRFLGVLVGAAITAVIQSSSATTVMVVGFVNSGMMSLQQAVWIIMGANIGTTITGQLIALDVGALAPALAFAGVALVVFVKNIQVQHWGQILAGLGVLFIGMDMMGDAMMPLRESEAFVSLMTALFQSPCWASWQALCSRRSSSRPRRRWAFCRRWRAAGPSRSQARCTCCSARTSARASRPCWRPSAPAATPSAPPSSI